MTQTRSSQRETIERIRSQLEASGWMVESQPTIGTTRPDLVATSPDGRTFVFELKTYTESSPVNYADLAQVQYLLDTVKVARDLREGLDVAEAVLITNALLDEGADTVSRRLGIEVLSLDTDGEAIEPAMQAWLDRHLSLCHEG